MYRAFFENSQCVIECESLKQLVGMVKSDLRYDLTHYYIPLADDPYETVRISKMTGAFHKHLFSMYGCHDSGLGYSVTISRSEPTNCQIIWQRD